MLTQDEDQYAAELLAGLDAYPAYYAHMGPANAAGPGPADLSPLAPGTVRYLPAVGAGAVLHTADSS